MPTRFRNTTRKRRGDLQTTSARTGTPTQQKKLGTGGRVLDNDERSAANKNRVLRKNTGGRINTSTSSMYANEYTGPSFITGQRGEPDTFAAASATTKAVAAAGRMVWTSMPILLLCVSYIVYACISICLDI